VLKKHCVTALGVLWALGACGQKFQSVSNGSGGSAGALPQAGASAGGSAGGMMTSGGAGGASSGGTNSAGAGVGGIPISVGGQPSIGGGHNGGAVGVGGSEVDAGEVPPIPVLGLRLWLRADRGVVQKDGAVSQWLDQSGGQTDASQAMAGSQPKFSATGFNQHPTIVFDGVDDYLKLPTGFSNFTAGISLFTVSQATVGDCASLIELSNGSEDNDISVGYYKDAWQFEVLDGDATGGKVDPSAPAMLAALQDSTSARLQLNGVEVSKADMPLPVQTVRQQNFIGQTLYGSCGYFTGQVSEIILYDRRLTTVELATVEAYLQDHWSCCK